MEKDCPCISCAYGKEIEYHLQRVPEEQRVFFSDMSERMICIEDDNHYYHAIMDGSWPSAVAILANALENAKAMEEPNLS